MVWSLTTPDGTEGINNGDDRIRELKTDLQTALLGNTTDGLEAKFPGSDTSNPIYRYRGLKGATGSRPSAGQYGLYFDTTRNALQRDNGTTWDDVGTVIPSGTKMIFYQASAPVGWTAVSVNDKFLRVVTAGGTGGSTGGTMAASTSLAHSHTVNSHTHTTPNHQHLLDYTTDGSWTNNSTAPVASNNSDGSAMFAANSGATTVRLIKNQTQNSGSGTSGATSPGTDTQFSGSFAYADIIIATKD